MGATIGRGVTRITATWTPSADCDKIRHWATYPARRGVRRFVPVAQLDRASASEAEGYRFDPYRERFKPFSSMILRANWFGRSPGMRKRRVKRRAQKRDQTPSCNFGKQTSSRSFSPYPSFTRHPGFTAWPRHLFASQLRALDERQFPQHINTSRQRIMFNRSTSRSTFAATILSLAAVAIAGPVYNVTQSEFPSTAPFGEHTTNAGGISNDVIAGS